MMIDLKRTQILVILESLQKVNLALTLITLCFYIQRIG